MKGQDSTRYIVRVANVDLDGTKPLYHALTKIKGLGARTALAIAQQFEAETGFAFDQRLGTLSEELDKKLEALVLDPAGHGVPTWMLNRRKDFASGKDRHLLSGDLDFAVREDIKRLNRIKSYRGLRHTWKLPVRGQKTKSTHRGKGGTVGVMKRDARK